MPERVVRCICCSLPSGVYSILNKITDLPGWVRCSSLLIRALILHSFASEYRSFNWNAVERARVSPWLLSRIPSTSTVMTCSLIFITHQTITYLFRIVFQEIPEIYPTHPYNESMSYRHSSFQQKRLQSPGAFVSCVCFSYLSHVSLLSKLWKG